MTNEELEQIVNEQIEAIKSVLFRKSKEYASDTDKLHNFKEAAKLMNCSAPFALVGMMNKHIVSVYDIVQNFEKKGVLPTTELLNEKIGDTINYLILLKACFCAVYKEEELTKEEQNNIVEEK